MAIRGQVLFGTHFEPGTVVVDDGVIAEIHRGLDRDGNLPETVIDADLVSPGLIDLQVNGADGVEAGGSSAHIEQISRWSVKSGVTAWLPTVVSADASLYPRVFGAFAGVDPTIGA